MQKSCLTSIAILLFAVSPALAGLPDDGERMAQTCASCHGTQGASPSSHIPVIGGQNAAYLAKTMKEYREGTRPGGVMANLAKGYSDGQIGEISHAVAAWKWKNSPLAAKSNGKKLAVSTESCAACHGKKGEGTALAPHIKGQSPGFLKEALLEYKDGKRKAPEMGIVKGMSDADFDQFVTYYTRK
ncbi:MAG: c-type cytochrome [Desulfuromonadaceae bacterium]